MEMVGAKVAAEEGSAFGYADAIIETKKFVWVFEFKFNRSANAAVRQIREKGYADAYKGDRRPVTLVGINFRAAKRNIDEPAIVRTAAVSAAGAGQGAGTLPCQPWSVPPPSRRQALARGGHVTTLPSRRRQYGATSEFLK